MMLKKKNEPEKDDIVISEEEDISGIVKKLKEKLKKCEIERKEYLDGWQRSKADFVNARKEEDEQRKNFTGFVKREILLDFIGLADNFEMAFSNKKEWKKADEGWRQGIEHIYGQLIGILERQGVEPIETTGKEFNPEEHHSAGVIEVAEKSKDGIIAAELQKGYKLNGKVIRPSQVKIGNYKIKE